MPPQCLACNAVVDAPGNLCPDCFSQFNFITPPTCHACGVPLDATVTDDLLCGACVREPLVYAQARAVFLYENASRSTGVTVDTGVLVRTKAIRSQGKLSHKARQRNVARAFSVRRPSAVGANVFCWLTTC